MTREVGTKQSLLIDMMLFGTSHSIRRAREARRRARLEERKRQRIMRATFSILAFVGVVITVFSMYELRRMKNRYEAAAAVNEASHIARSEPQLEQNAPITALDFVSGGPYQDNANIAYQRSVPHGLGRSGNGDSDNLSLLDRTVHEASDVGDRQRGESERSENNVVSKSDGGSEESVEEVDKNRDDRNGSEDTGERGETMMDSLDDEEGGNGPIITLTGKTDSNVVPNSTSIDDKADVRAATTGANSNLGVNQS